MLTDRALNRATLTRQLLAERSPLGIEAATRHVLGLQAQVSEGPYQGLWSRLAGFRHEALTALVVERRLVRATSFRATLHLHDVADMAGLRPTLQPVLDRSWQGAFGKRRFGDNVIGKVHRAGVKLLDNGPLTGAALGAQLQAQFPQGEALAKSTLMQIKEILVQIPPTRIWGLGHPPILARLDNWVPGIEAIAPVSPETLVLRYLAAYGPASIADMRAFSGLTGLGAAVAAVREQLVEHSAADGRILYDLATAQMPDADMAVAVRFLPDFDNALLGYAGRSRIIDAEYVGALTRTRSFRSVLVDGFVAAGWSLTRRSKAARLEITPFRPLRRSEKTAVEAEAEAFLGFMAPESPAREIGFAEN